jgi:hypothetical protein
MSLKGEVWTHQTDLILSFVFIEVFAQSQETERSCICVLRVSIFRCILELFHNVVFYVFQLIRTIWNLIILGLFDTVG